MKFFKLMESGCYCEILTVFFRALNLLKRAFNLLKQIIGNFKLKQSHFEAH